MKKRSTGMPKPRPRSLRECFLSQLIDGVRAVKVFYEIKKRNAGMLKFHKDPRGKLLSVLISHVVEYFIVHKEKHSAGMLIPRSKSLGEYFYQCSLVECVSS